MHSIKAGIDPKTVRRPIPHTTIIEKAEDQIKIDTSQKNSEIQSNQ